MWASMCAKMRQLPQGRHSPRHLRVEGNEAGAVANNRQPDAFGTVIDMHDNGSSMPFLHVLTATPKHTTF